VPYSLFPSSGIHGREIPDAECQTRDFERSGSVSLAARIEAIARHLTGLWERFRR
jgi:hypothetical protein